MNNKIKNQLFRFNITVCALIFATSIYEITNITSILFYFSFIISLAIFSLCINGKVTSLQQNTLLVLALVAFMGFISVFQGEITFNYLKKFIIYVTALSLFYAATTIKTEKKTVKLILLESIVLSVLCIIKSFSRDAYDTHDCLVLNFSNPNFTGMWLMTLAMLDVFLLLYVKKPVYKLMMIGVIGYMFYLCYLTDARNVWLSMGLFAAISALIIITKKKRFGKVTVFLIAIFPLLFALSYLWISEHGGFSEELADTFASEGKKMNSRVEIWKEAFSYFKEKPVFGAYSFAQNGLGTFQFHNTHVDTLTAYGVVGFILFVKCMYNIIVMAMQNSTTYKLVVLMCFISTVIFMGMGEASLFSTGMGLYIFCSAFLLLENYDLHPTFRIRKKEPQPEMPEETQTPETEG